MRYEIRADSLSFDDQRLRGAFAPLAEEFGMTWQVTEELDAGPIIEQDVIRVRHDDTADDLVRLGRDVERAVLSRGLRYQLEDWVSIHGNKTVVFD